MEQVKENSKFIRFKIFVALIISFIQGVLLKVLSICLLPSAIKKVTLLKKYREQNANLAVVVLCEHIGDAISCEPVSTFLKTKFNKTVVWIVNEKYKELIELFENVDFVLPVSCVSEYIYMSRFLKSFEIHNLHFDQKQCRKYGLVLRNNNTLFHMGNYVKYGSLLQTFSVTGGLPMLENKPHLKLDEKERFSEIDYPFCAIHVETNEPTRTMTKEKWIDIISHFPNIRFVEIGLHSNLSDAPNCCSNYCGKLSLVDSFYLVKKCSLFIGVDSSMAHVANALQKRSLIIMGRYHNYDNYMPFPGRDDNMTIVRSSEQVCDMSIETIVDELKEIIEKM